MEDSTSGALLPTGPTSNESQKGKGKRKEHASTPSPPKGKGKRKEHASTPSPPKEDDKKKERPSKRKREKSPIAVTGQGTSDDPFLIGDMVVRLKHTC